jgi:hypothetical protein
MQERRDRLGRQFGRRSFSALSGWVRSCNTSLCKASGSWTAVRDQLFRLFWGVAGLTFRIKGGSNRRGGRSLYRRRRSPKGRSCLLVVLSRGLRDVEL